MTIDYEIDHCTRRCATSERPLEPGETFYSIIVTERAEMVRRDYGADAWKAVVAEWPDEKVPPDNVVAWWRSELPDPNAKSLKWAPNEAMIRFFVELDQKGEAELRYVLCLLMIRRRLLRLEELKKNPDGSETMFVYCRKNESQYEVVVTEPGPARIEEIQQKIATMFFAGAE